MTMTVHKRSIHIDAPVEMVFDHVQDPRNFFAVFPEKDRDRSELTSVDLTDDGVGSTYSWRVGWFGLHMRASCTREEYVVNERIVDQSSTGPTWTFTFEPDLTGTTLTLSFEISSKVPLLDRVEDRLGWNGDEDLDRMLAGFKRAIEE